MEIEKRGDIPDELVAYLSANPTAPAGGMHVHVHHHYAPAPAPAAVPEVRPTVAEKVLPWLYVILASTVVLTICAVVFALVSVVVVVVLAALILLGLVAAHIVRSFADADTARGRRIEAEARAATEARRRRR